MTTKNQKELLQLLGSEYSIKTIDGEECIYRKINDTYDIEISGTRSKTRPMHVYVWQTKGKFEIVDRYFDIKDYQSLKSVLSNVIHKYQDLTQ